MVWARGMLRRPASVTKPERRECAEKSPSTPARRQRSCTIKRTAAGLKPAAAFALVSRWPPLRMRRKIAPSVIALAASQASRAAPAAPSTGLLLSGVARPVWLVLLTSSSYTNCPGAKRRKKRISACATSERRRPPLLQANSSSARSRRPTKLSSHVASSCWSTSLVKAAFFCTRPPCRA